MNENIKIKKILALSIAIILIVTAFIIKNSKEKVQVQGSTEAAYDSLFQKDKVIDIKVEIPESDWKNILDNPLAEEYKSADVTIDGNTIKNVGFRTKGNLTLRSVANSDSDRYSFRIKLDKYVKGQNLLGLDEIVVNNMYADPSFMREYLSYEALKSIGANVPETVFANIYVNEKLQGFYLCIEAIDDSYLERNFGNNNGNLYKQEKGSTLQYVEGGSYDSYEQKNGDDLSKTDLKTLIKTLNEMPQGEKRDIEKVLDVDSALKYIAANTVLGNYDSYNGNMAQNYYLYGQKGKVTVLPWDYNMSMGGFGGGNISTIPIDEPVSGVNIKSLPLINNLLAVAEYKEKYHGYVKALLTYLENFEERTTELANIIRPYVEADNTKFYTMEQFENNLKYTQTNIDSNTTSNANTNANMNRPENMPKQRPDGVTAASKNTQGNLKPENRPAPPEGGMDKGFMGGDFKGGRGGGGMMENAPSIMTYIKDRVENIKKQLSGELPTTGNTTMNESKGRAD